MSAVVQSAVQKYKPIFARHLGARDPRPTLLKFDADAGLIVELRDATQQVVELRLAPLDQADGALLRGQLTAVDLIRGEVAGPFVHWVPAVLAATTEVEREPGWERFLVRMARRTRDDRD
jgi:hypothetical protein